HGRPRRARRLARSDSERVATDPASVDCLTLDTEVREDTEEFATETQRHRESLSQRRSPPLRSGFSPCLRVSVASPSPCSLVNSESSKTSLKTKKAREAS